MPNANTDTENGTVRSLADLTKQELTALEYLARNYLVCRKAGHDAWHIIGNAIRLLLNMEDKDRLKGLITQEYINQIREVNNRKN